MKDTKTTIKVTTPPKKARNRPRQLLLPMWELLTPYPFVEVAHILKAYGKGRADITEALVGWHEDIYLLWGGWEIVKLPGNWALRKGAREMAYVGLDYPEQLGQALNEMITAEIKIPKDTTPEEELAVIGDQYAAGLIKLLGYLEIPF